MKSHPVASVPTYRSEDLGEKTSIGLKEGTPPAVRLSVVKPYLA